MKKLSAVLILLITILTTTLNQSSSFAQFPSKRIKITDGTGSPSGYPHELTFGDNEITDDGDQTFTVDTGLDNPITEALGIIEGAPIGVELYVGGDTGISGNLTVGGTTTLSSDLTISGGTIFLPNYSLPQGRPSDNQILKYDLATTTLGWEADAGAAGGDSVSIDSVAVVDPDFVSTGDIDFVDTSNTVTANINTGVVDAAELASTAVTPGSYTSTDLTVDADGRLTAASSGSAGVSQWTDTGNDVYATELDNVAIKTRGVPSGVELYLAGDAGISGNLTIGGTASVSQDLTVTGSTVLATNYGNVGIGMTAPDAKLVVAGGLNINLPADDNITIDGRTNPREVTVGAMRWNHTPEASTLNTRALFLDIDTNSVPNTQGIHIDLQATSLAAGETIIGVDIVGDTVNSTGGVIRLLELDKVGVGSAEVHGIHIEPEIAEVIHHASGTYIDPTQGWDENGGFTDTTTAFGSSGTDVTVFDADNDAIYIGSDAAFMEVEVVLETGASNPGIKPTFEIWTGASWTTITPIDNTAGFRESGVIDLEDTDLSSWVANTVNSVSKFYLQITRTQNSLGTDPIEDLIQTAAVTDFIWDESGNLNINTLGIGTTAPAVELDVVGEIQATSDLTINGTIFGTENMNIDSGTLYVDSGQNRVGIGTTAPTAELEVSGEILVTGSNDLTIQNSSILSGTDQSGVLTLGGTGGTYNENLTLNFESINKVYVNTTTGVTRIIYPDYFSQAFGSGDDVRIHWNEINNNSLQIGTLVGNALYTGYISIMEQADMSDVDRAPSATSANPVLRVYSSDATQAGDYIEFYHDQEHANIVTGGGANLLLKPGSGRVDLSSGNVHLDMNTSTDQHLYGINDAVGNQIIFTNISSIFQDHDHATQTNPTVFIHSDLTPNTNNTRWGSFAHWGDASNENYFEIATGAGHIYLNPNDNVGIGTTGPTAKLDVAGDSNFGGDLSISGTAHFSQTDDGDSGATDTIDWSSGNKHQSTLTGNVTFTFIDPLNTCNLVLKLKQDGTGSRTAVWPGAVKWPSGNAPILTTTANAIDIISFYFDGSIYYAQYALDFQ